MNFAFDLRGEDHARIACPFCSAERKKHNSKDMVLQRKADGALIYFCHHCGVSGSQQERKLSAVPAPAVANQSLSKQHLDWLASRGISEQTARKAKLFGSIKFFNRLNKKAESVGFPYFRDGVLVAVKYRSFPEKDFTQDSGGAHDFFGLDQVIEGLPLVIVEGEMDALTLMQAGVKNALSVPSGAPIRVADGKVLPSEDKKFAYVWNAREVIDAAPYVILATDQDPPGQALAEELARRIGKEKCRLAKFDKKDLNEVWMTEDFDRVARVNEIIGAAESYPISGLSDASQYEDRINDLFHKGSGKGFSTGFGDLDRIYTIAPGQMTVVSGFPSSGKSNVVDQIMVNLSVNHDWKHAICSFENLPEVHIARLMEIYTRKSFYDGPTRMNEEERKKAFLWVKDHFLFIDSSGEEPSTIDSILTRARASIKRMGCRGLVIDPYNYIDVNRDGTETENISNMLTKVQKFCKAHDVHTWFVAHPAKINRSGVELPRPDGMSISGSMAWWSKTDCGLTVHRGEGREVQIAVWKCRYRWVGTQGETVLNYNIGSGTYSEITDRF